MFDECDDKAQSIMVWFEKALDWFEKKYEVTFKEPRHDIARRFLNEIVEFKPIGKEP